MSRTVNDATQQKIGDVYQYFLALLDCFSLREGESLTIETTGDVSIISPSGQNRYQKEIKHHFGTRNLTDRDKDFWNTLDNWCKEKTAIAGFERLVLFTTANLPDKSLFLSWNSKSDQEKYDILQKCGQTKRKRESDFRTHYDNIFSTKAIITKPELLSILKKFDLYSSQYSIADITKMFMQHVGHIPQRNQDQYILTLLGWIVGKIKNPPHKWVVSKEEFDNLNVQATAKFADNSEIYIDPCSRDDQPTPDTLKELSNKTFVSEIERIDYNSVIPQAICDYWHAHTLVIESYPNDLLFISSVNGYRDDLSRRLSSEKRIRQRRSNGKTTMERIQTAQDMYDTVVGWPAERYGHIVGNQGYFQNGLIHGIVDSKEFCWYVEDDNEH